VPQPLVVWIIWGALVNAVLVYGGVGIATAPPAPEMVEGTEPSPLVPVLAVAAVVVLAVSVILRLVLESRIWQGRKPDLTDPGDFGKFLTIRIVSFALAESAAIFGLVLRLSGAISNGMFVAFLGAALVGLAYHAPLEASLRRRS